MFWFCEVERTGKKLKGGKILLLQRRVFHLPVMFLVAIMPLPAKGKAKPPKCYPNSWIKNYSCKILKSQLKAFDEYMFRHREIFKILYNITLLFLFNCPYLQNQEKQACFYKLEIWGYNVWCKKCWQIIQTWIYYPGANLPSFLLSPENHQD